MNRRSFLKRIFFSLLSFIGLSSGSYYYAKYIEPRLLTINTKNIHSRFLPDHFNQFRIVQFSDTHLGFHFDEEQLAKLVQSINHLNPDIIVFTGDLIDNPDDYSIDNSNIIHTLTSLSANYGKYWVYGNHDHGGYGTEMIQSIMDSSGFQLLKNNHKNIYIKDQSITILGVDDLIFGTPSIENALSGTEQSAFKILLCHEPDFAEIAKDHPVDLQLSGHSHGGQVRFPYFGALYTPDYATMYTSGLYPFKDNRLTLYVNNGIGTTRLPFRFLCKPEITVFELNRS